MNKHCRILRDARRDQLPLDHQRFFERNPQVCGGEPVSKGTRVTVRTIFASVADGSSIDDIIKDFPTVLREAVQAMIAYAAASAEEDLPVPATPAL